MAWDVTYLWPTAGVPTANELNQQQTNLKYLRGDDAGQTEVTLGSDIVGGGFYMNHPAPYVYKDYTSPGNTEFWFRSQDDSATPSIDTGDVVRWTFNGAGGASFFWPFTANQDYAYLQWRRTSASTGEMTIYSYTGGSAPSQASLTVNATGVGVASATPTVALKVDGILEATGGFLEGAADTTIWSVAADSANEVATFSGDTNITGSYEALTTDTEPGFIVDSNDKCANLNADLLLEFGWPGSADVLTSTGTAVGAATICSVTALKAGKYLVLGEATVQNDGRLIVAASTEIKSRGAGENYEDDVHYFNLAVFGVVEAVKGGSIKLKYVRWKTVPTTATGSLVAVWIAPLPSSLISSGSPGIATVTGTLTKTP